ncbi:MAG: DUF1326 domain-containing protein [Candidatus Poribacteria bacterium]|nr:DUF1326 domain-containing protein [Candidatus Poribacteria bacterium]
MRSVLFFSTIVLVIIAGFALATENPNVQGEYIEVRSASVYVGACHFGSEYVEGGKEATLIWNIHRGSWNNVKLDGLTVVAVISAKNNLAIDNDTRRSVLYVDSKATPEQYTAISKMLTTNSFDVLGKVVATKIVPIKYTKKGTKYDVSVEKILSLSLNRYPCAKCTQPHQIWYDPLIEVRDVIVGKSEIYSYKDNYLPVNWQQGGTANNVFVGSFSM